MLQRSGVKEADFQGRFIQHTGPDARVLVERYSLQSFYFLQGLGVCVEFLLWQLSQDIKLTYTLDTAKHNVCLGSLEDAPQVHQNFVWFGNSLALETVT